VKKIDENLISNNAICLQSSCTNEKYAPACKICLIDDSDELHNNHISK
jgi:hypothetical protein